MKLQITSLDALERLIGGDTEIELELRAGIVQDFTKKHLKALATDPVINKVGEAIKNEITSELLETYKNPGSSYLQYRLKPEAIKLIDIRVDELVSAALSRAVNEQMAKYGIDALIKSKLEYASTVLLDKISERNLEQRLNAMVEAKLKAAIGIK